MAGTMESAAWRSDGMDMVIQASDSGNVGDSRVPWLLLDAVVFEIQVRLSVAGRKIVSPANHLRILFWTSTAQLHLSRLAGSG